MYTVNTEMFWFESLAERFSTTAQLEDSVHEKMVLILSQNKTNLITFKSKGQLEVSDKIQLQVG